MIGLMEGEGEIPIYRQNTQRPKLHFLTFSRLPKQNVSSSFVKFGA